jgi:EKC/KEOPS complex subunit CGI121/TPRKB
VDAGRREWPHERTDGDKILSTTHVLAAVFRAASDMGKGRMKSRNVHSEVVLALSPNNNVTLAEAVALRPRELTADQIAESFRRFGIADQTEDLLVLKLATSAAVTAEGVARHLRAVHGRPVDFSNDRLAETCQLPRIMGIYKIQPLVGGHEPDRATAEAAILGSMALRGAS